MRAIKIIVKSWEKMEKKYGLDFDGDIPDPCYFVTSMRSVCGECVTVTFAPKYSSDYEIIINDEIYYLYPDCIEKILSKEENPEYWL